MSFENLTVIAKLPANAGKYHLYLYKDQIKDFRSTKRKIPIL